MVKLFGSVVQEETLLKDVWSVQKKLYIVKSNLVF